MRMAHPSSHLGLGRCGRCTSLIGRGGVGSSAGSMSSSELAEVLRDPCSRGPGARSSDWVGVRGSASVGECLSTVVVVSLTVSAVGQSQSCIVVCRCAGRALD